MGPKLSSEHSQIQNNDLLNRLVYVMSEQSKYLGEISVLRLNQKPYDYFMIYRQMAIESQITKQNIINKKQIYKALQNTRCIVRVEATTTRQTIQLCSNSIQFNSYCRYHNYTLQNAIQCKRNRGKNFRQADLLYIMTSLIGVGSKINQFLGKEYIGIFRSYKIYLSTEGYIKVYPVELLTIGKIKPSQSYLQTNSNTSSIKQLRLNLAIKQPQQKPKIIYEKDDIKDLANLMIQLIFLQKKQESNFQLQFMLNKKKISQKFKRLLLNINGNTKDFTFEMLNKEIQLIKQEQNIRPSYSIRLEEDISLKNSDIIKSQQDVMIEQKSQNFKRLASFQKNLVPSRINLLYKAHSSQQKADYM